MKVPEVGLINAGCRKCPHSLAHPVPAPQRPLQQVDGISVFSRNLLMTFEFQEMQARKEKLMSQIRNELAINGAQELLNVSPARQTSAIAVLNSVL